MVTARSTQRDVGDRTYAFEATDYASPLDAYSKLAQTYDRFRPGYPQWALDDVRSRLLAGSAHCLAVDVGCGTGIFTRQLASAFPACRQIIGIEPNSEMRSHAVTLAGRDAPRMTFLAGVAEQIPLPSEYADLVTAATAATWFDRRRFYPEAARVLKPGGVLAVLMNRRCASNSPLLAEYEAFQQRHLPEYRPGTYEDHNGNYAAVNFAHELRRQPQFIAVVTRTGWWSQELAPDDFLGLSMSRSDMRRIGAKIGVAELDAWHADLIRRRVSRDGRLCLSWETEVTTAVKVQENVR